ncbi:helix-turn-helix transcriptional regulator [Pseudozobellia thermophila]|uniref:Helix-turn-helix n=1 Tax=Pseudozobellia thermophila TaxID=192903 RepID=A0A1M6EY44_9FLAO|nr:helix-turn-helix transcriptional regulator [Pseudozobellia thermophila]SHI90362.1 Helix-turn-helix [Pseudozobellia thermophila]
MVNTAEFIQRLEYLLKYYGLSASGFADKVKVQRSSISHLLSGRNKPSLEFVLKVVKAFPEVNLYWLLNGKGAFPGGGQKNEAPAPKAKGPNEEATEGLPQKSVSASPSLPEAPEKTIDKIVIFYSDGTFRAYSDPT